MEKLVKQSKSEATIWQIFMNAPGAEAVALLQNATKILIARNVIKAPRIRNPKEKPDA